MKRKFFVIFFVCMLFLVGSITAGTFVEEKDYGKKIENNYDYDSYEDYPVMIISRETAERWEEDYNNAELAYINPNLAEEIQSTEVYSILDLLEYDPETRSQGYCGNCWAWPATGVLAIALNVQEGIKDRLSVQFINTCGERYTYGPNLIECCGGGNLAMFENFYRKTNMAIPWSNTMAHWHDDGRINCVTDCSEISKSPNYPIYDINDKVIKTRNVPEEEAIENIKNILHQQRGVYFSVFYPDLENLNSFREMWRNDAEDDSYDLDYYCGNEWNTEEAVGHAMLIVGYHDVEGTENDYWIVLNSWGTTNNRPNGMLAWDMHMDYSCKYSNYYAFGAGTLEVDFKPDPEAPEKPTISGPNSIKPDKEYTFEFSAVDPQGDDVYIYVQWTIDMPGSGWLGPYKSGEVVQVNHTWTEEKNFVLMARARDPDKNTSIWSSFDVIMPRVKEKTMSSLDFLPYHPHILALLQKIIRMLLQ
jgi:hypothetical protein